MTSQLKVDRISPANTSEIIIDGFSSGGKVLQAVNYNQQVTATTTSGSYVDTGVELSITPTSSSSYIVYSVTVPISLGRNTPIQLLLNGSVVSSNGSVTTNDLNNVTFNGVYTNTSTSPKTFKVQWYQASDGNSTDKFPSLGSATSWGSGAPAWPHINHSTGYLLEVER